MTAGGVSRAGPIRGRIFAKYILVTLLIGTMANAAVLAWYYRYRDIEMGGQAAAEIATVANRVGPPAADLAGAGETGKARQLLSVFAAYAYVVCADLRVGATAEPAVSWPAVGCARMNPVGPRIEIPLPAAAPGASLALRLDPVVLDDRLAAEFLVLISLGAIGGLALTLAGGGAFLWFINRPLARFLSAIERFDRTGEPHKAVYGAADEIGRVVAAYNAMLDREVARVEEIRDAHRAIVDSVAYATRIQRALLPPADRLDAAFGEHAVLWQPRDLVGGDLYWVFVQGDRTTLAVLDCTGHGVPGGFMSTLAVASLERIFAEEDDPSPARILVRLNALTRRLLHQAGGEPGANDGMDAAVCRIDARAGTLVFAGARLSLVVARGDRVERLRADRFSIGYRDSPEDPDFTETVLSVDPSVTLVLATDGLIDQPGHGKGIAFGHRRLLALIRRWSGQPLAALVGEIDRALGAHAGAQPRRDDVTVVAFRPRGPAPATDPGVPDGGDLG